MEASGSAKHAITPKTLIQWMTWAMTMNSFRLAMTRSQFEAMKDEATRKGTLARLGVFSTVEATKCWYQYYGNGAAPEIIEIEVREYVPKCRRKGVRYRPHQKGKKSS